eukprot:3747615-Amphidinium_carterae.1
MGSGQAQHSETTSDTNDLDHQTHASVTAQEHLAKNAFPLAEMAVHATVNFLQITSCFAFAIYKRTVVLKETLKLDYNNDSPWSYTVQT